MTPMELVGYVEAIHRQLLAAAEAGGDEARTLVRRLAAPIEASVRLVLLDALADAAEEITRELAPGSVEVRLRGREPEFVVSAPPTGEDTSPRPGPPPAYEPPPTVPADADDTATARVTLRLPEALKARIEQAAGREAVSVNAWLVRAATDALDTPDAGPPPGRRVATGSDHFTGWAR
jgi:hypothetical protein